MNRSRAIRIEEDVRRRLDTSGRDVPLDALRVAIFKIRGGRRMVEVVEIRDEAERDPLVMYGVKQAEGPEAAHAIRASDLGIGPSVLDVSDDEVIVEEFFPQHLNIRHRAPARSEFEAYAGHLAWLFMRFMLTDEEQLVYHRDERADHIFVLGDGESICVKLIDWGRAAVWPLDRFEEWGMEQFYWYYGQLSLHEPVVWRAFLSSLARAFPERPGGEALANAYMRLVRYQVSTLRDALHRASAIRFLEFLVKCGRVGIDLQSLNDFVEKNSDLRGEELAQACCGSLE